jgi:hypothetical protein
MLTSKSYTVRRLEIEGRMPREHDDVGQNDTNPDVKIVVEDDESDDELSNYAIDSDPDHQSPSVTYEEDKTWRLLADFIRELPALADLVYNCSSQFLPCLLGVLDQELSECRLHMKTFYFRSLHQQDTNPHEFSLASSPCLYSILSRYSRFYGGDKKDFNREAILRTVSGLAPNLKEVRLFLTPDYRRPVEPAPGPSWQGFSHDKGLNQLGSLDRFELLQYDLSKNSLESFSKHIDFSALKALKLQGSTIMEEALGWMATSCSFHSLTTLVLVLERSIEAPSGDVVRLFFRSFPPLKALRMDAIVSQITIDTTLEHHGKSLRNLWLSCVRNLGDTDQLVLGIREIDKIRQHCPLIENLNIPISRSMGDAQEIAIYKALGALPKLRRLSLTLDSSDLSVVPSDDEIPIPNDPSFDEFERKNFPGTYARNGHVRDVLINCALDEKLARAILQRISESKPQDSFPLERISPVSTGAGEFGVPDLPMDLSQVFSYLGGSWRLVRSQRDDSRDKISAIQSIRRGKTSYEENQKRGSVPKTMSQATEAVFRRIWPHKQDGSEWRDDWYSWPLAES